MVIYAFFSFFQSAGYRGGNKLGIRSVILSRNRDPLETRVNCK